MSINEVTVSLTEDVPISRLENSLTLGDVRGNSPAGINSINIRFNEHFHVEVKQQSNHDVLITLTTGGVSKQIDMQTFHQLIAMNY